MPDLTTAAREAQDRLEWTDYHHHAGMASAVRELSRVVVALAEAVEGLRPREAVTSDDAHTDNDSDSVSVSVGVQHNGPMASLADRLRAWYGSTCDDLSCNSCQDAMDDLVDEADALVAERDEWKRKHDTVAAAMGQVMYTRATDGTLDALRERDEARAERDEARRQVAMLRGGHR